MSVEVFCVIIISVATFLRSGGTLSDDVTAEAVK